ncbi:MAG: hypothetical protein ACYC8T_11570 [Myxococcaceae bacterium]
MTFRKLGLLLAGAGAALVMSACGENDTPDGGTGACTATSCATDETCHPTAKICVKTCTGAVDCPSTAKTCAPQGGGAMDGGAAYCQCATDQLCNSGGSTDLVCSNLDKICVAKCASNGDCGSGRTCTTATGQCAAAGVDAGTDGGTGSCGWASCSTAAWSGSSGQQCNGTVCGAGPACAGTGKSTCDYGSTCAQLVCGYPPAPSCPNFTPPGGKTPLWNPASSAGPVIYEVSEISHGPGEGTTGTNFKECTVGTTEWRIRIRAYRTDADWPATRAGLPGFFYVDTNGGQLDILGSGLLMPAVGYNRSTTNLKDAEFQVYQCPPAAPNAFLPGFYFTGGNEACRQL